MLVTAIRAPREQPAEQLALPVPEDKQFAAGPTDRVFGDPQERLREVDEVSSVAPLNVRLRDRGQQIRRAAH
jgi:hypothetical protein